MDIVNRYDIDGLHFDDYFYQTGTIADEAAYLADPRGFPNTTAGRADWRRDNVSLLVERIGSSIRTAKPWVKFGISPSGIYRSDPAFPNGTANPSVGSWTATGAFQHFSSSFADTRKWLQSGWLDYLAPQLYWFIGQTGSDYQLLLPWWDRLVPVPILLSMRDNEKSFEQAKKLFDNWSVYDNQGSAPKLISRKGR